MNNNMFFYYNNCYYSNIRNTNTNLSKFKFSIRFTFGNEDIIEGKPNDTLKLKLEEYLKKIIKIIF